MFVIFAQLFGTAIIFIYLSTCKTIMQKVSCLSCNLYSAKLYWTHSTCTNIFWIIWPGKGVFWNSEKLIRPEISWMDRSGVMTFGERVRRRRIKRGREKSEKLSTLHVSLMSLPSASLCCSVVSATPLSRQSDLSFPLFRLVTDTPASRCYCRSRKKPETFRKIASDERNVGRLSTFWFN